MKKLAAILACLAGSPLMIAERPPLLPEPIVAALAGELSGETAKRNVEFLARLHRMRGSSGFRAAAEFVAGQARAYGLADARIEQFPADGKTFYGAQKARPAWDAEFAELWELRAENGRWAPAERLASWEAMPVSLAQDSESAEATAELVDVGEGTAESDYANKQVRGRIVLAATQPGEVARLAVERFGAVGIISYAQNQRTAWWGEDENLIRWGHLDSFSSTKTFAFMVSLKRARELQQRLRKGETIRLQATVRAGRRPGFYDIATATIPGADPRLRDQQIVFSCHLDHPRPGANDNASGCAAILEVARSFAKLVAEGKLPPPARTLRFVWPPEIEGTMALLNARPELAPRIRAVVHMDMVGGGPTTKAIFSITRSPASLPSFVNDIAEALGEFVNHQSAEFARTGQAAYPLAAPEGGKEALLAQFTEFSSGSDHQVYAEGSFRIPAIYLHEWPDRYIHTNFDAPANLDATKLKRAAFLGACAGYFLANLGEQDAQAIWQVIAANSLRRTSTMLQRRVGLAPPEAAGLTRFHFGYERALVDSMERFFPVPADLRLEADRFFRGLEQAVGSPAPPPPDSGDGRLSFRRNPKIKGPLSGFGYDYLADHYGEERVRSLRLLRHQGLRGSGAEHAYEALNFVDGRRTAQEIRDSLAAVYGPLPLEAVVEHLRALESIGVVELVR